MALPNLYATPNGTAKDESLTSFHTLLPCLKKTKYKKLCQKCKIHVTRLFPRAFQIGLLLSTTVAAFVSGKLELACSIMRSRRTEGPGNPSVTFCSATNTNPPD